MRNTISVAKITMRIHAPRKWDDEQVADASRLIENLDLERQLTVFVKRLLDEFPATEGVKINVTS